MDLARLSSILMIVGFVFFVSSGIAAPPRVYRVTDFADRIKIIEEYPTRWKATNFMGSLGALITAIGFLLFGAYLWKTQNQVLISLGVSAFTISAITVAIQGYRRVVDPTVHLSSVAALEQVWLWSFLLAILFFGFIFLKAGYPTWLGYLSIGSAIVLGTGAFVTNIALAEVAFIIPLIVAIVILRNS